MTDIDLDAPEYEDTPKSLRDAYKKLQKQLADTAGERDRFKAQVVSAQVGSVLADRGFKNPKRVERDLLSDNIDPLDKSAVDEWLEINGDDYARTSETPASEPDPAQNEAAQNLAAIQSVAGDSSNANAQTNWERAQQELATIENYDGADVKRVFAKHGV